MYNHDSSFPCVKPLTKEEEAFQQGFQSCHNSRNIIMSFSEPFYSLQDVITVISELTIFTVFGSNDIR